jgi:hypothetical protein
MTAKKLHMYPVTDLPVSKVSDVEENWQKGFIRVYRSLAKKAWYKKSEYVHLWVHLFIKATRKDREDWFNGQPIILKPGQFITGRKKLQDETGINQSKIERILRVFKNDQQIEQVGGATSRLISILNWHLYQNVEQQSEQQLNNGRTTDEQQVNTIQETREYREYKEEEREGAEPRLTHKQFYSQQIEANKEHPMLEKYKALVDFMYKANDTEKPLGYVLKMEDQLTFNQYLKLREKGQQNRVDLRDVLMAMQNEKAKLKGKTSVYCTINTWANIRVERQNKTK